MPEVEKAAKKEMPEGKAEKPKEKAQKGEEGKPEKGKLEEKLGEEPEGKPEGGEPKKGGFKLKLSIPPIVKNIAIFFAAFVVLVMAAYLLTSKVLKPFMKAQIQKSATQKTKAVAKRKVQKAQTPNEVKEVFLVSDMIINPAETNGTRFLNTTIGLGVGDPLAKATLEERAPQVRDALISILTTKTIPELVHPDGKKILRTQIMEKVNKIIAPNRILEVYFVDFVLQ
ncbi:MAG: flagellar basal body-associated FliL family protein [candidate division Zixibacteria bacterium]|nr:flagellar basal body-associated FliL family protein [candidate division Zixibacteria bacterium]